MIKILMLSGGTESTALLFKTLEQEDNLFVHHVQLINCENRHEAENYAVENIVREARKIKPFVFTSSTFHYPDIVGNKYAGMDIITISFIAGHVASQLSSGFNSFEFEILLGASKEGGPPPEEYYNSAQYKSAVASFESHFIKWDIKPKLIYPYMEVGIKDQYSWIPDKVKPFINSCRRPNKIGDKFIRCGFCHTCHKLNSLEDK